MNWAKRHKLWSLLILYFGIGCLFASLPFINAMAVGELMGIFFLPYLFLCFAALKALRSEEIK